MRLFCFTILLRPLNPGFNLSLGFKMSWSDFLVSTSHFWSEVFKVPRFKITVHCPIGMSAGFYGLQRFSSSSFVRTWLVRRQQILLQVNWSVLANTYSWVGNGAQKSISMVSHGFSGSVVIFAGSFLAIWHWKQELTPSSIYFSTSHFFCFSYARGPCLKTMRIIVSVKAQVQSFRHA